MSDLYRCGVSLEKDLIDEFEVEKLANLLKSQVVVKHVELSMSTTGSALK